MADQTTTTTAVASSETALATKTTHYSNQFAEKTFYITENDIGDLDLFFMYKTNVKLNETEPAGTQGSNVKIIREPIFHFSCASHTPTQPVFGLGFNIPVGYTNGVSLFAGKIIVNAFNNIPLVNLLVETGVESGKIEDIPPMDFYIVNKKNNKTHKAIFQDCVVKDLKIVSWSFEQGIETPGRYFVIEFIASDFQGIHLKEYLTTQLYGMSDLYSLQPQLASSALYDALKKQSKTVSDGEIIYAAVNTYAGLMTAFDKIISRLKARNDDYTAIKKDFDALCTLYTSALDSIEAANKKLDNVAKINIDTSNAKKVYCAELLAVRKTNDELLDKISYNDVANKIVWTSDTGFSKVTVDASFSNVGDPISEVERLRYLVNSGATTTTVVSNANAVISNLTSKNAYLFECYNKYKKDTTRFVNAYSYLDVGDPTDSIFVGDMKLALYLKYTDSNKETFPLSKNKSIDFSILNDGKNNVTSTNTAVNTVVPATPNIIPETILVHSFATGAYTKDLTSNEETEIKAFASLVKTKGLTGTITLKSYTDQTGSETAESNLKTAQTRLDKMKPILYKKLGLDNYIRIKTEVAKGAVDFATTTPSDPYNRRITASFEFIDTSIYDDFIKDKKELALVSKFKINELSYEYTHFNYDATKFDLLSKNSFITNLGITDLNFLLKEKSGTLVFTGYTDASGSEKTNSKLSINRINYVFGGFITNLKQIAPKIKVLKTFGGEVGTKTSDLPRKISVVYLPEESVTITTSDISSLESKYAKFLKGTEELLIYSGFTSSFVDNDTFAYKGLPILKELVSVLSKYNGELVAKFYTDTAGTTTTNKSTSNTRYNQYIRDNFVSCGLNSEVKLSFSFVGETTKYSTSAPEQNRRVYLKFTPGTVIPNSTTTTTVTTTNTSSATTVPDSNLATKYASFLKGSSLVNIASGFELNETRSLTSEELKIISEVNTVLADKLGELVVAYQCYETDNEADILKLYNNNLAQSLLAKINLKKLNVKFNDSINGNITLTSGTNPVTLDSKQRIFKFKFTPVTVNINTNSK